MSSGPLPLILLLGGSFNPPHIGHFRAALEAGEILAPEKILFLPAASPPHKTAAKVLPFAMRVAMLKAVTARLPSSLNLGVCEVEGERDGPSYTIDTLEILSGRYPDHRLVFVMGAEDFATLKTWRRWQDIPAFADIIVIPRKHHGRDSFYNCSRVLWPGASPARSGCTPPLPACVAGTDALPSEPPDAFVLPGGGSLTFLPQPLLQISSSCVRARFLAGLSLDFLIPGEVRVILEREARAVRSIWA